MLFRSIARSEKLAAQQAEQGEGLALAQKQSAQMAALATQVAAQGEVIASQAEELATLHETLSTHAELILQLRGHMARLEKQAALDLDEMRRTNTAALSALLLRRPPNGTAALAEETADRPRPA